MFTNFRPLRCRRRSSPVSDLVTCPTCQSVLRLPPTAATVRCPKCKTLLQVVEEPAAPPAPPLPLTGAARPKPAPAQPAKAQPAARKGRRPTMVLDEVAEAEVASAEEAKQAAERRKEVRRQLAEMDEEEEAEEEEYEDIQEQCKWGRIALQWLQYGTAGYALGALAVFAAMVGYVVLTAMGTSFGAVMGPLAMLGLGLGGLSMLVMAIGFGVGLKGPKLPRHTALFGLIATAGQIICVAATLGLAIDRVLNVDAAPPVDEGYKSLDLAYYTLGLCTNLFLLTDAPTRIVFRYAFPAVGVAAGIFEFARLVFLCQLSQTYAELGKNHRFAADAGTSISQVFWVLLLTCLFRFAISIVFDGQPVNSGGWVVGQVLHGLLFLIAFGFFAYRLLMVVQMTRDTLDVLTAERVAAKVDHIDAV
jgi:LSD1 subclass zinc finger protein